MSSSKEYAPTYTPEISSAIRRYGWVVSFPSFYNLLALLFATSVCSWFLSLISKGLKFEAIFAWVSGLALVPLIMDSLFLKYGFHGSLILDRRRLVAISVTCNTAFIICVLAANILAFLLSTYSLFIATMILGMSIHFMIRLAAFSALGEPRIRVGSTSLYHLATFAVAIQGFPTKINRIGMISAFIICWIFSAFLYSLGLLLINRIGIRKIGIPSLKVFNAYLKSRLIGLTQDFEDILYKLGEERDIDCWLILFNDEDGKNLLGLATTSAHFGPFDNVGSGGLSHKLRLALEAKLQCPVVILRELSNHSMDLASKRECEKLIYEFLLQRKIEFLDGCSPLVTKTYMNHNSTLLISDGFCLIILSRAPMPTEDLPSHVRDLILNKLASQEIKDAVVVDAHNCIGHLLSTPQDVEAEHFVKAVCASITEASKKVSKFQVGFCRKYPSNVSINDGLGPDGISAVVFHHGNEISSLIIIDGNNMIVGLRDKIIEELNKTFMMKSEVVTTDTHLVTGISRVRGGYNPLGVKVSSDLLIGLCKEAVSEAIASARPARMSITSGTVKDTRVVGNGLIRLAELLEVSFSTTKKLLIMSIFVTGLISYLISTII